MFEFKCTYFKLDYVWPQNATLFDIKNREYELGLKMGVKEVEPLLVTLTDGVVSTEATTELRWDCTHNNDLVDYFKTMFEGGLELSVKSLGITSTFKVYHLLRQREPSRKVSYFASLFAQGAQVGQVKLEMSNKGLFVNQNTIDRVNKVGFTKRHVYRGAPDVVGTFDCAKDTQAFSAENTGTNFDPEKAKRLIAYKNRRDGLQRCPHTSNSLSPQKMPAKDPAEAADGSTKENGSQKNLPLFCGVPNTNYTRVDVRQGEMTFVEFDFTNHFDVQKSF